MPKSLDNRESCLTLIPSSCVPYTGYVSNSIKEPSDCKLNINDVLLKIQNLIDSLITKTGDNNTIDKKCLSIPINPKQSEINQVFITELCSIKTDVQYLSQPINPNTIQIIIDLLCLQDPLCAPKTSYTLQEVLNKLVNSYCNLLTRVKNIENLLSI